MINIYFIRHAQTEHSGKGYIALDVDSPISNEGINNCKENCFKKEMFDNVYVSPTKRAKQTAKFLYPYKDAKETKLIAQKKQGEISGHFRDEYDEEYLDKLRNYEIIPNGAEDIETVLKRVNRFLDLVIKENPNTSNVLTITHNGIMRIIAKHFGGLDLYLNSKHLEGFIIKLNPKTKSTKLIKKVKLSN